MKKAATEENFVFSPCSDMTYTEYTQGREKSEIRPIAEETATALFLNGKQVTTLISSPHDMMPLAVGYCLAEGLMPENSAIQSTRMEDGAVYVEAVSGPAIEKAAAASSAAAFTPIAASALCRCGGLLDSLSAAHHSSHGVHEGALVRDGKILAYTEDIGRHNVLDRLRGLVALQSINVFQAVLIFSGRVPQSVITKVHGIGVPVIASRALPTTLGISLAETYGITLVCGLRPDSFRLFTHHERICLTE